MTRPLSSGGTAPKPRQVQTDVPLEFCLLQGEVAEAFDAWRKGKPDLGGELADIAIFLLGLAQMTGHDLAAEVEAKLTLVEERTYVRLPDGTPVKDDDTVAGERTGDGEPR